MNSSLIVIPNKGVSREDWLARRKNGLGASEVGTVLGLNQYKSPIELFYDKLDLNPQMDVQNIYALMGLQHEETLDKMWRYCEGTQESIVRNYMNKNIVRKCQKVNASIMNPKYPWLFVSLDRKINKTKTRGEGALEFKTMNGWVAKKFIGDVPPSYLVQVQGQILVCEFEFGELFTMTDGTLFDLIPFERRAELEDQIIELTRVFWYNRVIPGRKILTQKYHAISTHNIQRANELQSELEQLEPDLIGTEQEEQYLKERYRSRPLAEIGLIKGNDDDLSTAMNLRRIKDEIKDLEGLAQLEKNKLIRRIGQAQKLDFGGQGYVSHAGNPKTFRLSLK